MRFLCAILALTLVVLPGCTTPPPGGGKEADSDSGLGGWTHAWLVQGSLRNDLNRSVGLHVTAVGWEKHASGHLYGSDWSWKEVVGAGNATIGGDWLPPGPSMVKVQVSFGLGTCRVEAKVSPFKEGNQLIVVMGADGLTVKTNSWTRFDILQSDQDC